MTGPRPRVLFVSHEATLTGAPMMLLHLVRWLAANSDLDIEVMLLEDGPLAGAFGSVARRVMVRPPHPQTITGRLLNRLALPPGLDDGVSRSGLETRFRTSLGARVQQRRQPPQRWDLAYVNTIVGTYALPMIDLSTPVLVHVHELLDQPSIAEWLDRNARFIDDLQRRQPQFLAVGERVKEGLVRRLGVAASAVEVCYEFIPTAAIHVEPPAAAAARAELGLPDGAFIVGGSGTMDWRKGIDLFVQVASRMRARGLDDDAVRFVWVGGDDNPHSQIRYDIARMGLGAMVQVVPTTSDPRPYFANFNVFALTSRIDPFPLVCLEAAALAKPIVCFDSGGMPEFVEADCGYVVPYGDVEAMTDRLDQLRKDLALRERMGIDAAAKVRARHDLDVAAPGILDSIRRVMS